MYKVVKLCTMSNEAIKHKYRSLHTSCDFAVPRGPCLGPWEAGPGVQRLLQALSPNGPEQGFLGIVFCGKPYLSLARQLCW